MATSNGPTASAPALRTVLPTITVRPGAVTAGVAAAAEISRSDPTRMGVVVVRSLLVSFASATAALWSARTIRKYVPTSVPGEIVTGVTVVAVAAGARPAAIWRVATTTSLASMLVSRDR